MDIKDVKEKVNAGKEKVTSFIEEHEVKEKLSAGKDKVNAKIKGLAFRGIVEEKVSPETRAKYPILDKLIPLTNYIVCSLVVVIGVMLVANIFGSLGSTSARSAQAPGNTSASNSSRSSSSNTNANTTGNQTSTSSNQSRGNVNSALVTNTNFEIGPAPNIEGVNFTLDDISAGWTVAIMSGTIFDVFTKDLKDSDYNTELKKKVFLESNESEVYQRRLEELRNIVRTQGIRSIISRRETGLSDYDLTNSGFWLTIGRNFGSGTIDGSFKFAINGFLYEKLPVREMPMGILGPNRFSYEILLPIKEDVAVNIEGNRDVRVRLEMRITGVEQRKFTFYDVNGNIFDVTRRHPVASIMKIVLFDERSNNVFGEFIF